MRALLLGVGPGSKPTARLLTFHLLRGTQVVGVTAGSLPGFQLRSGSSVAPSNVPHLKKCLCLAWGSQGFQAGPWESRRGLWRALPPRSCLGRVNWGWEEFPRGRAAPCASSSPVSSGCELRHVAPPTIIFFVCKYLTLVSKTQQGDQPHSLGAGLTFGLCPTTFFPCALLMARGDMWLCWQVTSATSTTVRTGAPA